MALRLSTATATRCVSSSTLAASSSRRPREKLPSTVLSLVERSPFHFLRSLKVHIGLPLTAAESNPLNRYYDEGC
jgi:hypothetical protein